MKKNYREIAFLLIPIFIASLQIFLHESSDLVSWRGGGFGMYSDPHAKTSRKIWVTGLHKNDSIAIRLYPLDRKLIGLSEDKNPLAKDLKKLRNYAKYYRDFPSGADFSYIKEYYFEFTEKYADDEKVNLLFPYRELEFVVMQQALGEDFKSIETEMILKKPL